jgi:hypothetical protein
MIDNDIAITGKAKTEMNDHSLKVLSVLSTTAY